MKRDVVPSNAYSECMLTYFIRVEYDYKRPEDQRRQSPVQAIRFHLGFTACLGPQTSRLVLFLFLNLTGIESDLLQHTYFGVRVSHNLPSSLKQGDPES